MSTNIQIEVLMKNMKYDQLIESALREGNFKQAIKVSRQRHKVIRKMILKYAESKEAKN